VSVQGEEQEERGAPDVRYIVKLRDNTVPVVRSSKTVLFVHLRREVTKDKHSGGVRAQKDRSHKQLKILECSMATRVWVISMRYNQAGENDVRFIIRIELDDYEISIVWEMVSTAEGKILRVGFSNGTIGELRGGVGEEGIPPIEETRGIAVRRNWVVPCTMTRRDWVLVSTGTSQKARCAYQNHQ